MPKLGLIWVDYVYLGERLVEVWINGERHQSRPPTLRRGSRRTAASASASDPLISGPNCPASAPRPALEFPKTLWIKF